jgi:2-succinyl-5-enolpyruvyl-6-hydroxy-3-cyclohexene-1-carboxylate synthase
VLANRGVNGIDGITSSALGVAAGQSGPVVCLLGDLAFLHDVSALAALSGPAAGSCTLVVLDNGGGGIFNFLPHAEALPAERFERLFGTAPAASVASVGRGFGLPVAEVATLGELDAALGRFVGVEPCALVRVAVPERAENRSLHDRVHAAVGGALGAGPGS